MEDCKCGASKGFCDKRAAKAGDVLDGLMGERVECVEVAS